MTLSNEIKKETILNFAGGGPLKWIQTYPEQNKSSFLREVFSKLHGAKVVFIGVQVTVEWVHLSGQRPCEYVPGVVVSV